MKALIKSTLGKIWDGALNYLGALGLGLLVLALYSWWEPISTNSKLFFTWLSNLGSTKIEIDAWVFVTICLVASLAVIVLLWPFCKRFLSSRQQTNKPKFVADQPILFALMDLLAELDGKPIYAVLLVEKGYTNLEAVEALNHLCEYSILYAANSDRDADGQEYFGYVPSSKGREQIIKYAKERQKDDT